MMVSYDVLLDPLTGDLTETAQFTNSDEKVMQSVQIGLGLQLGDYILDTRAGIPYLEWGASKSPSDQARSDLIRAWIVKVDGVQSVKTWSHSREDRELTITGELILDTGTVAPVRIFPYTGSERINSNPIHYSLVYGLPKVY